VVADQWDALPSTLTLASACWAATASKGVELLHLCDAGEPGWYDFAIAIGELRVSAPELCTKSAQVTALTTPYFTTRRAAQAYTCSIAPKYAARHSNLQATHWRELWR